MYDKLEKMNEELRQRIAVLESNDSPEPKKKKRSNDIGLKILDGGKPFGEEPPFAPQPQA